eukprot:7890979-Alexandrium_andersonii.AAC.1
MRWCDAHLLMCCGNASTMLTLMRPFPTALLSPTIAAEHGHVAFLKPRPALGHHPAGSGGFARCSDCFPGSAD